MQVERSVGRTSAMSERAASDSRSACWRISNSAESKSVASFADDRSSRTWKAQSDFAFDGSKKRSDCWRHGPGLGGRNRDFYKPRKHASTKITGVDGLDLGDSSRIQSSAPDNHSHKWLNAEGSQLTKA